MFNWLGQMLGINELKERVAALEAKVDHIEIAIGGQLKSMGKYKSRTEAELRLMKAQLEEQERTISVVLDGLDDEESREKLLKLRQRVRLNDTLCEKAIDARVWAD